MIYKYLKKYQGRNKIHKELYEALHQYYEKEEYYKQYMAVWDSICMKELDKPASERVPVDSIAASVISANRGISDTQQGKPTATNPSSFPQVSSPADSTAPNEANPVTSSLGEQQTRDTVTPRHGEPSDGADADEETGPKTKEDVSSELGGEEDRLKCSRKRCDAPGLDRTYGTTSEPEPPSRRQRMEDEEISNHGLVSPSSSPRKNDPESNDTMTTTSWMPNVSPGSSPKLSPSPTLKHEEISPVTPAPEQTACMDSAENRINLKRSKLSALLARRRDHDGVDVANDALCKKIQGQIDELDQELFDLLTSAL